MPKRLPVAIAHATTVERPHNCSTGQPEKRDQSREVETDDQLHPRKRYVEPTPVGRVQHPLLGGADRIDPAPLLFIRNRHPLQVRLPGQIVNGVPRDARTRRNPSGQRGLP